MQKEEQLNKNSLNFTFALNLDEALCGGDYSEKEKANFNVLEARSLTWFLALQENPEIYKNLIKDVYPQFLSFLQFWATHFAFLIATGHCRSIHSFHTYEHLRHYVKEFGGSNDPHIKVIAEWYHSLESWFKNNNLEKIFNYWCIDHAIFLLTNFYLQKSQEHNLIIFKNGLLTPDYDCLQTIILKLQKDCKENKLNLHDFIVPYQCGSFAVPNLYKTLSNSKLLGLELKLHHYADIQSYITNENFTLHYNPTVETWLAAQQRILDALINAAKKRLEKDFNQELPKSALLSLKKHLKINLNDYLDAVKSIAEQQGYEITKERKSQKIDFLDRCYCYVLHYLKGQTYEEISGNFLERCNIQITPSSIGSAIRNIRSLVNCIC